MTQPTNLEDFIVSIEDSATLLKLYLERLSRTPGKAATYCEAICQHGEEIAEAVETFKAGLYGPSGELVSWATPHLAASAESLADLAELTQYTVLRLATMQVADSGQVIETLTEATTEFAELVRGLGHPDRPYDLAGIQHLSERLRELLAAGSVSFLGEAPLVPVHPTPQGVPMLDLFEGEDPFDELALGEDFLDDVIGGLDGAFDRAVGAVPVGSPENTGECLESPVGELSEAAAAEMLASLPTGPITGEYALQLPDDDLKELFANIAAAYVQPVKEFISELRRGKMSREWLEICRPAVQSIARAAESMDYVELTRLLTSFDDTLETAHREPDARSLRTLWRPRILQSYSNLEAFLPQTFHIVEEVVSSEGIIINSLLKQVKGVGQGTIKKLFAIGMTSLDVYYIASPGDVSAAAGIKPWLAERICDRFRSYQREMSDRGDGRRDRQVALLAELVEELKRQQFLFKRATLDEWYGNEAADDKRRSRKERQRTMWKVNVLLAEIGEIGLVQEIRNLVFEKRIARLQEFLDSSVPRA